MRDDEWLAARGATLQEYDLGREDEPDIGSLLLIEHSDALPDAFRVFIRPGLDPADLVGVTSWARRVFERYLEHGPEPDGWQLRTDGDHQLWGRKVYLPPI